MEGSIVKAYRAHTVTYAIIYYIVNMYGGVERIEGLIISFEEVCDKEATGIGYYTDLGRDLALCPDRSTLVRWLNPLSHRH